MPQRHGPLTQGGHFKTNSWEFKINSGSNEDMFPNVQLVAGKAPKPVMGWEMC
jgi:hypothetical protein